MKQFPPSLEVPACQLGDEPQGYKEKVPRKRTTSREFLFFSFALHSFFVAIIIFRYYFKLQRRPLPDLRPEGNDNERRGNIIIIVPCFFFFLPSGWYVFFFLYWLLLTIQVGLLVRSGRRTSNGAPAGMFLMYIIYKLRVTWQPWRTADHRWSSPTLAWKREVEVVLSHFFSCTQAHAKFQQTHLTSPPLRSRMWGVLIKISLYSWQPLHHDHDDGFQLEPFKRQQQLHHDWHYHRLASALVF